MTAYAYLRKSVVKQDDPNNSPEAQEAAVKALAALEGDGDNLVILSDWDKSGKLGRDKRPGYDALWQAIEGGKCTAVYSYSFSRLGRKMSDLLALFDACSDRGIPVRLRADKIDTGSASGRMVAGILASVATFESDVAGERRKAANGAKLARGESLRTVPLYGSKPGHDPAAVLAAWHETGSFNATAALLNERHIPCRNSKRGWWPSSVARLVRRLDPTIPPEGLQGVKAGAASAFTLARLLTCGTCGTMLSGHAPGARSPEVRYVCRRSNLSPHPRGSIRESAIMPAIIEEVAHLRTPSQMPTTKGDVTARADLEARRLNILDMREAGQIDRAECDRRLTAVTEALGKLDARRVILSVPPVSEVDWTKPPAILGTFLRAVFERIELDPETMQPRPDGFTWKVPEARS
jgi:DNA invertase Pin-like site-specific DNA recombinase